MENTKISIKDIIDEFEITKNRAEFTNDLNLFFNMMAFDNSKGKYYNIIKNRFNDYMKDWDIDLNKNFMFICKYIKSNKLPYKIAKDEGFENIKSDKFIISILVELYAIKIIISNKEIIKKYDIANFIYKEFMNNGIEVRRNDIVLNDLEYIFKDDNIYSICKSRLEYRKEDVNKSIVQVIKVLEGRKNIKVNLRYMITYKNNNGRNLIMRKN